MSLYYFENHVIVAPVTFENKVNTLSAETASLREYRRRIDGQRWDLSFKVISKEDVGDLFDSLLDDDFVVKTMDMPQLNAIDKAREGLPETAPHTVVNDANAGDLTIDLNFAQEVRKGSFIQFSNHSKIYSVRGTYAAGAHTVSIYPELRAPVTTSHTVLGPNTTTKPQYNYRRDLSSLSGVTYRDGVLADIGTIKLLEVV